MLYHYTAVDRAGATQKGDREVPDEKALAKALRDEGFLLVSARTRISPLAHIARIASMPFGGVSLLERIVFARNLAVMIGAGLSMTRALEAQEEQTRSRQFKKIIRGVRESILGGVSFSQSLESHRKIFGDLFIHMVEAGEVSGKLEKSLKLLSRQMKRDYDLRRKVRGAMMYPSIVFMALIAIGVLMLIYVVPTLTQTFKELGIKLPLTTRVIIAASEFATNYIFFALGGLLIVIYLFYLWFRSDSGKRVWGIIFLRLPVFGPLTKKLNIARMTRTLASLISAGLSITRSLEITGRVVGNARFQESLGASVGEIEKGRPFSEILRTWPDLYPPLVFQLISVGEETGTLSRMLLRIALFYEEDVNNTTKNLSSIIEPLMMIVIGAIVGLFAISMIQPLYSSMAGI
ncbi:MAG: type II secretion system F family protein [Candidatus Sungbacteria bacterium]|uniref:Type II secretion system F family protein n=1 Tax=Candidatus Sungiibacteriota bacterium TaxID=2750080 RepID=A0A931WPW5_9BACT|nr:type II secretion system F family protein [Candidatus Sungbacteria bacterium]